MKNICEMAGISQAAYVECPLKAVIKANQNLGVDLILIPTEWSAPANFSFYFEFGYEAYLAAIALYPEAVEKLYWHSGVLARARNEIIVKLYNEFDFAPILFCGHDICTGQGPMCSPAFLKYHYWKYVKESLTPFAEPGIRFLHHCDGNVMPLVDDMLASGFTGFQGFQYEFGVDPYVLKEKAEGIDLLFLGGLSITYTLPLGTEEDVKAEVEYAMDFSDGGKGLFLFTSNVTGIDVPARNLITAYTHLDTLEPGWQSTPKKTTWPWLQRL